MCAGSVFTTAEKAMSKITIHINHDSLLWPAVDRDDEIKSYSHSWGGNTVRFGDGGITITCEVELSEEEQAALVKCLTKDRVPFVPHWQTLTPDVHRTVQRIEKQVWQTARIVDYCFRRSPKGIRLTPLKLPKQHINQSQAFPVMHWQFSEEERDRLSPLYADLSPEARRRYDKGGIMIPFSVPFDQKQIHMRGEEVDEVFEHIDKATELPPYWALYGIAWENFAKNKSHDSAILILATSIETALKRCLKQHGDDIANYFIEKMQSPSLDKLYLCAREHTPHEFPEHFRPWLMQLAKARNFVAHKPRGVEIDVLQIARWFAVGEAILKAIIDKENDSLVGYLIEPVGKRADEKLPPNTRGVVLRREEFLKTGEERLHVILDSGESWYFGENAFSRLPNAQQKFPDVE